MNITSKIGIGTVQFGLDYGISNKTGKTLPTEVGSILKYARSVSIKYLDTASAYGDSESILGSYNAAENFRIVSKFMPSETNGSLLEQFVQSCKLLKTNYLYGFLAHRPMALLKNRRDWDEIQTLQEEGKVNKIGFSLNAPFELEELLANGLFPDIVQVPFNYFDRRFVPLMKELRRRDCEIHSRSVFLQGLFFSNLSELSSSFDDVKETIGTLQGHFGPILPKVLLKYALSKEYIDVVIVGVQNVSQLKLNLEGLELASELPELTQQIPDHIVMPSKWI